MRQKFKQMITPGNKEELIQWNTIVIFCDHYVEEARGFMINHDNIKWSLAGTNIVHLQVFCLCSNLDK